MYPLSGFFVSALLVASLFAAGATASRAAARTSSPGPGIAYVVGAAAQGAARSYWTPARMAAATGDTVQPQAVPLGSPHSPGPPRGTPDAVSFGGVSTVGALFYTKGRTRHFCTASVVSSSVGTLILTAAHCVYSGGYSANIAFVPGYHDGLAPYSAWAVAEITVAKGWRQRQDPGLDYAFLDVVSPLETVGPIQDVTGALKLGFSLHDAQHITVIGYNDTDQTPIRCATKSFKFSNSQMKFYCRGFWYGTSGGPWIIGFNGSTGGGTVFGVIGGYEDGGYQSWASYSTILWRGARALFSQAEAAAA